MARFDGPFSTRHRGARAVTAFSLLSEQIEKQPHGFFFPSEMMDHRLTLCANAPPFPEQANIAEEVRFDRHGIVARHVLRYIGAFDIEVIGLCDHETRIADPRNRVQRQL